MLCVFGQWRRFRWIPLGRLAAHSFEFGTSRSARSVFHRAVFRQRIGHVHESRSNQRYGRG